MKIQFNAFDKNSSASHSKTVWAKSKKSLKEQWDEFETEVNGIFFKWYYENIIDEDETTPKEKAWAEELDLLD